MVKKFVFSVVAKLQEKMGLLEANNVTNVMPAVVNF